jgi:DNA-binding NtrC family response regulator
MNPDIKILILDKEEIIFKSIQKALKNNNEFKFNIIFSTDAFEGLKYIRNNKFDMVIIDLLLPGMNATELIRRIKNIDSAIPVVIMSGFSPSGIHFNGNSELQDETLKSAAGFLLKPFTTEEIKSLVLRTLKKVNPVERKK